MAWGRKKRELCATRRGLALALSWSSQSDRHGGRTGGGQRATGEGQMSGLSAIRTQGTKMQRDAETWRVRLDEQLMLAMAESRATS